MSSTTTTAAAANPKLEDVSDAYKTLVTKLSTLTQLERVSSLLRYDQMVFMPEKAARERGAQMAALAGLVHEKATDPEILRLIEQASSDLTNARRNQLQQQEQQENQSDLLSLFKDEERLLELERKHFVENDRVPPELAARKAALMAQAHSVWAQARQENDFAKFEPLLQQCFDLTRQVAEAKRGNDDNGRSISFYEQMLDEYEMGMSQARIDEMFDQIQKSLVPLIEKVLGETATPPSTDALTGGGRGEFPIDKQKELSRDIVTTLGFDATLGRLDVSVHPFTQAISPSDVRITSRFRTDEWYRGLAATIHEGGHGMYEQNAGRNPDKDDTSPSPLKLNTYLSMGMHESQSLFWERHVGLSKPFWQWATPKLKQAFGADGGKDGLFDCYTPGEIYGAVNAVSRSLIRVEADELTYPLHVILRYHIERDVIAGALSVKDIPQRWNAEIKSVLGGDVVVPSDTLGCLQDVHWAAMAVGYFPTYLIGSSAAAQLAHYCKKDLVDFDDQVARGEFAAIKKWLNRKVHQHGRRYKSLDAHFEAELGEPLNPQYFINYLTEKYTDLYKC